MLTVDRVGYRYPGAEIDAVREVSFVIRRGQTIAIVGAVIGAVFAFRNGDNGSSTTPDGPTITFGGAAVGAPPK